MYHQILFAFFMCTKTVIKHTFSILYFGTYTDNDDKIGTSDCKM